MIRVYLYDAGTKTCRHGGPELLPSPDTVPDSVWIDLEAPTPEEEAMVFDKVQHIHPLTLEDITRPRRLPDQTPHLPKVEEFADYLFVIANPLHPNATRLLVDPGADCEHRKLCSQLSAVIAERILITHHTEPLLAIEALRGHLGRHESTAGRGPDYLFHIALDVMVDQYSPLLDSLSESLDELEAEIFDRPSPALLAKLLGLKRHVIALRKTLIHEREVLARLSRGEFGLIDSREAAYYRNVYDHLLRFTELVEASREMVSDLMQTLLASQANKLNEVMKVLTMISTTILPMALLSGIYGMNFEQNVWPDFKTSEYGFPGVILLMVVSGLTALGFFRWKKWI